MENLSDRIQDYIEGNLKGEELTYFEEKMMQDKELFNLVSLQREVHEILNIRINDPGEKNLRTTLQEVNRIYKSNGSSNNSLKRWMPIVAAASILIFGALFFMSRSSNIYDLPLMQSEIVRGMEENASYEDAVKAFNKKMYSDARNILISLTKAEPDHIQYQYYLALTYVGEKQWQESIIALSPIANGESIFANEAKYYLALAFFETNEKNSAQTLLQEIPQTGKLGEKAKKLEDKMN